MAKATFDNVSVFLAVIAATEQLYFRGSGLPPKYESRMWVTIKRRPSSSRKQGLESPIRSLYVLQLSWGRGGMALSRNMNEEVFSQNEMKKGKNWKIFFDAEDSSKAVIFRFGPKGLLSLLSCCRFRPCCPILPLLPELSKHGQSRNEPLFTLEANKSLPTE